MNNTPTIKEKADMTHPGFKGYQIEQNSSSRNLGSARSRVCHLNLELTPSDLKISIFTKLPLPTNKQLQQPFPQRIPFEIHF